MPNFKEVINRGLEDSSLSPLNNISRSGNIWWKILWLMVFVLTLAAALWQGYGEVMEYLSVSFCY